MLGEQPVGAAQDSHGSLAGHIGPELALRARLVHDHEGQQLTPIDLADRADLFLVAPLSADTMGNFAHGLAPDPLSSIYLATKAKVLLAPAMNGTMWNHSATQRNASQLVADGCQIIGPEESGILACGYQGAGRLVPIDEILEAVEVLAKGSS